MELQTVGIGKTYITDLQAAKNVASTFWADLYGLSGANGAGRSA